MDDKKKAASNLSEKILAIYRKIMKQMVTTGLDPELKLAMTVKGTREENDLKNLVSLMTKFKESIKNIPETLFPSYFCVYCGEEKENCHCEIPFFIQGNLPRDAVFQFCRSRPVCTVCNNRLEFHKFGNPCEEGRFICYELPISVLPIPAH